MKTKTFDCVAMKHEIQQELKRKFGKGPWAGRNDLVRDAIQRDPHLLKLLRTSSASGIPDRPHQS
jgi:hypothetical protein